MGISLPTLNQQKEIIEPISKLEGIIKKRQLEIEKLDDAETNSLTESREQLFNYMIDIVHEYKIPDKDALSEEAVNEFVKCRNNTNTARRIQFLESNKNKYENFGEYWLLCAKSYYEDGNYQSCLDAKDKYDSMNINIFRKDHNYADVLPLAIA